MENDVSEEAVPRAGEQEPRNAARLSPAAFAARLSTSWRTLWCITASVLGSPDEADDIVQEASLIALKKLDEFDSRTNFTAWMAQIVRYVALNARRSRAQRSLRTVVHIDLVESARDRQSEDQPLLTGAGRLRADQKSFDDQVLAALHRLEETARACLLLRTIEGLSYREIALALSIPEGTAMSHVHRARRAMREILSPKFEPQAEPQETRS